MGLEVGAVTRVAVLPTRAFNSKPKDSEIDYVSEFYKEFHGYDRDLMRVPQVVPRTKTDIEV